MKTFLEKFTFDPSRRGFLGVEREFFLSYPDGRLAPDSPSFLEAVDDAAWTYELSACQVEHRTRPCGTLVALERDLRDGQDQGWAAAKRIGRRLVALEVGPATMPTDIYPHNERYREIVKRLPTEVLLAACRVAGVHIHVGVGSPDEAVEAYNVFVDRLDELIAIGDHSEGERLRLYSIMAPEWRPERYASFARYHETAVRRGWSDNPRNCWSIVRISRHGTVELRMFGMTGDVDEIVGWAKLIRSFMK